MHPSTTNSILQAWVNAYRDLASANQHHEVMVAFSSTGEQVGWTLMCSSTSIVADDFAFLPLCPSGENTGLIACVGVEKSARGKGVGLALLVKAMENLMERGVKGVLIDVSVLLSLPPRSFCEPEMIEHCIAGNINVFSLKDPRLLILRVALTCFL